MAFCSLRRSSTIRQDPRSHSFHLGVWRARHCSGAHSLGSLALMITRSPYQLTAVPTRSLLPRPPARRTGCGGKDRGVRRGDAGASACGAGGGGGAGCSQFHHEHLPLALEHRSNTMVLVGDEGQCCAQRKGMPERHSTIILLVCCRPTRAR